MPERVELIFGQGIDREAGIMAAKQASMSDLRNVLLRKGKVQLRRGVKETAQFVDSNGTPITRVLAGQAVLGDQTGLIVGYQGDDQAADFGKVLAYIVSGDGSTVNLLDTWFTQSDPANQDAPVVQTAEVFGKVFLAHDHPSHSQRHETVYYDSIGSTALQTLTADLDQDGTDEPVKFRGVARHLDYLVGWGFGTPTQPRPELVRTSLPAEPTTFRGEHYAIVGNRGDPVVTCHSTTRESGQPFLMMFKETETYRLRGTGPRNFGTLLSDERFGCVGSRLATTVSGTVYFWSNQGPRATRGGPSRDLSLPLALDEAEPSTLAPPGDRQAGWCEYIPTERLVVWFFGQRGYVLSIRRPQQPRWSYWELPFTPESGFSLYQTGAETALAPQGGVSVDFVDLYNLDEPKIYFTNTNIGGDEKVEVWGQRVPNHLEVEYHDHNAYLLQRGGGCGTADQSQVAGYGPIGVSGTSAPYCWSKERSSAANGVFDVANSGQGDPEPEALSTTSRDFQLIDLVSDTGTQGRMAVYREVDAAPGEVWNISCRAVVANLTNAEAKIEGEWLDGGGASLGTFTKVIASTTKKRHRALSFTAPANTATLKVQFVVEATANDGGGKLWVTAPLAWRDQDAEAWQRVEVAPVTAGQQSIQITDQPPGTMRLAVRHRRGVQYHTDYTSSDPDDWPQDAHAAAWRQLPMSRIKHAVWERVGGPDGDPDTEKVTLRILTGDVFSEFDAENLAPLREPVDVEIRVDGTLVDTVTRNQAGEWEYELFNPDISGETEHKIRVVTLDPYAKVDRAYDDDAHETLYDVFQEGDHQYRSNVYKWIGPKGHQDVASFWAEATADDITGHMLNPEVQTEDDLGRAHMPDEVEAKNSLDGAWGDPLEALTESAWGDFDEIISVYDAGGQASGTSVTITVRYRKTTAGVTDYSREVSATDTVP